MDENSKTNFELREDSPYIIQFVDNYRLVRDEIKEFIELMPESLEELT